MNIYDFDGTIYPGDSTRDFLFYAVCRNPGLLRFLPGQGMALAAYALGRKTKTQTKEAIYRVFTGFDAEKAAEEFWESRGDRICAWYLAQKQETDVVISASPEFLLRPICRRLGIGCLIASRVNPSNGKCLGENCQGKEKPVRLMQTLGVKKCERFYSDSLSDAPMAALASEAFLVKGQQILPWKENIIRKEEKDG